MVRGLANRVSGRELLRYSYSYKLVHLISLGIFLSALGRSVIPLLLPVITSDLSITSTEAGFGLTLMTACYAVTLYPGGHFSDNLSRKTVLVGSMLLMTAAFLWLTKTVSYLPFLVGLGLIGLAGGLFFPASRGLVADLFPSKRSGALGMQTSATAAGATLAAGWTIVTVSLATWQISFLPAIVGLTLVVLLYHHWSREPYDLTYTKLEVRETLLRLLSDSYTRLVLAVYATYAITWHGVMGFLPLYLQQVKGVSFTFASSSYGIVFLIGIPVSILTGIFGNRFSPLHLLILSQTMSFLGLSQLILLDGFGWIFLSILVFAAGMWSFSPLMETIILDYFPRQTVAGDLGAFKTIYLAFASLGPVYVGYIADQISFLFAFGGFLLCLIGGLSILSYLLVSSNYS